MAQQKQTRLGMMRLRIRSLALLTGLRIWGCRELWCRSQMQLRSGIALALAQASSYSSYWTPSLGTSICSGHGPEKTKDQKKKNHFSRKASLKYQFLVLLLRRILTQLLSHIYEACLCVLSITFYEVRIPPTLFYHYLSRI